MTARHQRDGLSVGGMSISSGGGGRQYGSETGDNSSAYGGGGAHGPTSPSHSQSNSMTSSYRNIQHVSCRPAFYGEGRDVESALLLA